MKNISVVRILATVSLICVCFLAFDAHSKKSGFSSKSAFSSKSKTSSTFNFRDKSNKETRAKTPVYNEPNVAKKSSDKKQIAATSQQPRKVDKKQHEKEPPKQQFGAHVKKKQKVAASKDAFKRQQSAFKQRKTVTDSSAGSGGTTAYERRNWNTQDNVTLRRASTYDRSTYYSRRASYYDDWSTPSYAYNSYSSFGVWDSIALWYMLDNIHNPHYVNMYYHQMNTPGMQSWRLEASRMENAELRAKLARLDAKVDQMERDGITRDESYLPPEVDADIFLSEDARDATRTPLKLCTGELDKNYHAIGAHLARNAAYTNITLVPTNGSAENLQKLDSGECDAALAQRDSYLYHLNNSTSSTLSDLNYVRLFPAYNEVVHLVCHTNSGIEDLTDLKKSDKTLIVGGQGSGSSITWSNLVAENEKYGSVRTLSLSGQRAKSALSSGQADCLISVSGLKTDFMKSIISTSKLELVEWNDSALNDVIDPARKKVYTTHTLPGKVYPSIQLNNWTGSTGTSTEIAMVPADFIVSNRWAEENELAFERFSSHTTKQLPQIRRLVGNK